VLTPGAEPEAGEVELGITQHRRPKHPQVLLASGLTAAGVPELLSALDEHHATRAATAQPHGARLARARAQVEGILADRMREALWSSSRRASAEAVLEQVAAHELDPYTAADRLLDDIAHRIRVRR
jgi:LAO/AO transport system kinase